jgi:sulfonate transport system ATP-binding protein
VAEAVALADRVVVLDHGGVAFELRVSHPRPRRRGSADLAAIEGRLLTRLLRRRPAPGCAVAIAPDRAH